MATNEEKKLTQGTSSQNQQNTATNSQGVAAAPYTPSAAVTQAQQMLNQQQANKPGAYQSTWQQQANDTLQQILNRKPFTYDLNSDALYQQLTDQYVGQGKMAMIDTVGQTAALTGGYGNSYAQNAGQQAYHGYLQQLNAQVPELYQMALDQHNQEGQDLMDQYALLGAQEEQDYGRYMDQMDAYYAERDRLQSIYDAERDYDYGKWADERNFAYQQERDAAADAQWQAEYDEAVRQWNAEHEGSSGGSGSRSSGSDYSDMGSADIRSILIKFNSLEEAEAAADKLVAKGADAELVYTTLELIFGVPKPAESTSAGNMRGNESIPNPNQHTRA